MMIQEKNALLENTVALQVYLGMPGIRTKVDKRKVEVVTDKTMLHVSKDIFDSVELRKVRAKHNEIRAFVRSRSLPSPLFKGGVYLIPLDLIDSIERKFAVELEEVNELIEEFIKSYTGGLIDAAKKRLGDLFNPADYPPPEWMRQAFRFEWTYLAFNTPDQLGNIKVELLEREREKFADKWAAAEEAAISMLAAEFQKLVDHMLDRLTPDEDGKPKIFKNTMISNFSEFLKVFPFRNVSNVEELDALVEQSTQLLDGVDAQTIRDRDAMRNNLSTGFTAVKTQLDTFVTTKPKRLISFDDDV